MASVKLKFFVVCIVVGLLGVAPVALADWDEGDPYKMHWPQLPDLAPGLPTTGMDVYAMVDMTGVQPPVILADDFLCEVTGPITDIHIWGSWANDYLPEGDPGNVVFTLSFHTNISPDESPTGYSMPGPPLWQGMFGPGQFTVRKYATIPDGEWWYEPWPGGQVIWPYDWTCYQYNFYLDPDEFIQEGSPDEPVIYWLNLQAQPLAPYASFGWKTTRPELRWNDDACWVIGVEPFNGIWNKLTYPGLHPYHYETVDLAFVITGPELDWGDAPDPPYPTLSASIGANHVIAGPWMGDNTDVPDPEPDGQPVPPAAGDDLDGNDDEDGLTLPTLTPGQPANFNLQVNNAPAPGAVVEIWIDYNIDGDWDDPGELAYSNTLTTGMHIININVPAAALPGMTFARGRISSAGTGSPRGPASDGEVEDTEVYIEEPQPDDSDCGDAPEDAMAYPSLGIFGAFPTCMTCGAAGHVQHASGMARFELIPAPGWDAESDGDAGLCPPPGCFPPYDADECFLDGDAGLMFPDPYTIDAIGSVVPCPLGVGAPLGTVCQTAVWGGNVDIFVVNNLNFDVYVNVLMDWNQDGQWYLYSSGCPVIAWEHVLKNFVVPAGYAGPLSGLGPPNFQIGPNAGYIWTRFSVTEVTVPASKVGWNGEGAFQYGETEDYLLLVKEVKPAKPLIKHSKWSQPPIEIYPDPCNLEPPVYSGWNELSYREVIPGGPEFWQVAADDFRCLGNIPITSVHFWGSYFGWEQPGQMPDILPIGWRIGFWSNVPADTTGEPGYSYPQELLWQIEVDADRVDVDEVGTDYYHGEETGLPNDVCYQYTVKLEPDEWFWQAEYNDDVTEDNIYWLSIAAIYDPCEQEPPYYLWGWKTRPTERLSWMDDAVRFWWDGPLEPGVVLDPYSVEPMIDPLYEQTVDLAFELDTDPNWIKWEQHYTGIRHWPHYEDEVSMGTVERTVETIYKWIQKPDLSPYGIDVDATYDEWGFYQPQILADDFNCITTGPITDIHIYGSWWHDDVYDPWMVKFTLSFHEDLPVGDPRNPYPWSIPGKMLWWREFYPGEFIPEYYADAEEGYYMPCTGIYDPFDHFGVWKYSFYLHPGEFIQEGTETNPVIYWLDVQAMPMGGPPDPFNRFGWKTAEEQRIDDAVWAIGMEQMPVPGPWEELLHPEDHESLDLAFEITSEEEKEELVIHRLVADDWRCDQNTPVTAAVWWGSYLGYQYQPCHGEFMPLPVKPDYFLLTIWDDVPVNPDDPISYSHPNDILWKYEAYDYDEVLVGYDKHPLGEPNEPVFRYSVSIPEPNWFDQKDANGVYWFSVVAVYDENEPYYDWGWTNHEHMYNDDAVAGYLDIGDPDLEPEWFWEELYDQTGKTEDMSFILYTEECMKFSNPDYPDWAAWNKPDCWCFERQCRGDINGKKLGPYWVQMADLSLFKAAYLKMILPPGGICADLNHAMLGPYRVQMADLTIFKTYYLKMIVPSCPTAGYNFWITP